MNTKKNNNKEIEKSRFAIYVEKEYDSCDECEMGIGIVAL